MQATVQHDRARTLLRTCVGRDGGGEGREALLRRLLVAAERKARQTHGQPEGAPWRRLVVAIRAELGSS